MLTLAPNNSRNSIEQLLRTNKMFLLQRRLQFCEAVQDVDKLKTLSFRIADVAEELHLFKVCKRAF